MIDLFINLLTLSGIFIQLVGMITVFKAWLTVGKAEDGYDQSNRLNNIRLWWMCVVKDKKLVEIYPWLKGDIRDWKE